MKKIVAVIAVILIVQSAVIAQDRINVGGGYFGETAAYPGAVGEFEFERMHSPTLATPLRTSLGFYVHPRSSTGVFLDAHTGSRKYFASGLFLEHYIGIGALLSFYNEEMYHIEGSSVALVSRFGNFDIMPSVTLGVGYRFSKHVEGLIYFRPKVYWQIPFNNLAAPHIALQAGYVHTLKGGQ